MTVIRYTIIDRPGAHDHIAAWRGRCTFCGHRCPVDGVAPVETRRRPWRIPWEIIMRFRAMMHYVEIQPRRAFEVVDMTGYQSPGLLSEAELDEMDRAGTEIDPETDLVFNRGGMVPEFPPRHLRIASQTAELKRALAAYQAAVEAYANRLADPAAYADPSIQSDDTLSFDDGLGEEFEAELDQWEMGRD